MNAGEPSDDSTASRHAIGFVLELDHIDGVGKVTRPDGRYAVIDLEPSPRSPIARSVHVVGTPYLVATTDRGEEFTIELPLPGNPVPLDGRKVVYLDQQAWSKLTLALYEPDRLLAAELAAATWLIDLVTERLVVLPYSAGVIGETTHWADRERRRRLALTVASLSRGWQMLDPLVVRDTELKHALAANPEQWPLPDVWTLEPMAAIASRGNAFEVGPGIPVDLALVASAASSALAVFSTLLDEDPIPRVDVHGWAAHWGQLAAHVAETKKPKHLTELAVHGAIIADAQTEITRAAVAVGATPEDVSRWIRDSSRHGIGALPALGLAREVTTVKILNSGAKWVPNDLVDIFYLVQAAGYADAVVGERGFVALLDQAQRRLARSGNAYRSLEALKKSGELGGSA